MPSKKTSGKKNINKLKGNEKAIIPTKEKVHRNQTPLKISTTSVEPRKRVTALSTMGRKKKSK